jgi:hypothetical protein
MSGRWWLSKNIGHGIRIGRSIADWTLPRYKRFELRTRLQTAAKARGEPITKEEADYCIDRALATGALDRNGTLRLIAKGETPEEAISNAIEAAAAWGETLTRSEAERLVIDKRRHLGPIAWTLIAAAALVAVQIAVSVWGPH